MTAASPSTSAKDRRDHHGAPRDRSRTRKRRRRAVRQQQHGPAPRYRRDHLLCRGSRRDSRDVAESPRRLRPETAAALNTMRRVIAIFGVCICVLGLAAAWLIFLRHPVDGQPGPQGPKGTSTTVTASPFPTPQPAPTVVVVPPQRTVTVRPSPARTVRSPAPQSPRPPAAPRPTQSPRPSPTPTPRPSLVCVLNLCL